MGDGTSSKIGAAPPPGVIAGEHEIWPPIPQKLLKRTPKELRDIRDSITRELKLENESIFPRQGEIDGLENSAVIVDFSITAVTRMQQTGASQG